MKKVLCVFLTLVMMLPCVLTANAQTNDFACHWGFENEEEDYNSEGGLEIRFEAFTGATGYYAVLYKDGQAVEQEFVDGEMFTEIVEDSAIQEFFAVDMSGYIVEFGSGTYTCTVSAVEIDYNSENFEPKLLATTPMSNPYVYTEPTVTLSPVQNVVYDGSKITFAHEANGMELTYQMECCVEYGDYRTSWFFGNSDFIPEMTEERTAWMWEHYEEQLSFDQEYSPEFLERGAPKLVVVIYAKAWDINKAMQSPKTYFYPNGEKATYTEPYAVPVWTESKNAMLSFEGTKGEIEAYNIYDNNYFKLRDIAMKLTEMGVPVDVTWDAEKQAINLITGVPYTPAGGELKAADNTGREAVPCKSRIYLDGQKIDLKAYTINGNNFFKLRDLCAVLNVKVGWDEAAQLIILNK